MEYDLDEQQKEEDTEGLGLLGIILFVFGAFFLIAVILLLVKVNAPAMTQEINKSEICSMIEATPSWVQVNDIMVNENIVFVNGLGHTVKPELQEQFIKQNKYSFGYGYREDENVMDLINNQIYFVYNPYCMWCIKQIEVFGEDFSYLVNKNYTINCLEVDEDGF